MTGLSAPEAVVFDLDGVVTFTARVHFAAWKELFDGFLRERAEREGNAFRPFEEADYREHVDGRPRFDGVRSFLASRGIPLEEGNPGDPPGSETVQGLGGRKNELFRERVRRNGVDVDAEAVRLVRDLRAAGVRVGAASSSRNVALILEATGLGDLFDARVDGSESERLGLRGKPAPDIFLECLERLGSLDPSRAVVVEDAVAGVEAGRAGGFGLVLGVDRGEHALQLREHGADWIIRDFSELDLERLRAWFESRRYRRPNALAHWPDVVRALEGRRPALFLDYDGTLTPIVDRPEHATLSEGMRTALRAVARAWPTTIVSGRGREDVESLVGIPELYFAGSHGFDISGPGSGESGLRLQVAEEIAPVIRDATAALRARAREVPGLLIEDKTYSVAVHYRLVEERLVPSVERLVDEVLASRPELRKTLGKKVFELRPAVEWDKGRAVLWLLEALGLDGTCPIYIGDDVTDEDAFRALEKRGIGVLVTEIPRPTAARYSLQEIAEVRAFLDRLVALDEGASR